MSQQLISIYRKLKEVYGPQHWWPADTRFEIIVGTILTQNTAWSNVERAIWNLKRGRILSVRGMSNTSETRLASLLRPAGYFNVKARRLKNFLNFLHLKYQGRLKQFLDQPLPLLREELLSVNGIGPETADSILLYAAEKPVFVVDAYTRRIFSRIGAFDSSATYEAIQRYFVKRLFLKRKIFNEFHALIVEHAKRFCKTKPVCGPCPLRQHCQYAGRRRRGRSHSKDGVRHGLSEPQIDFYC